MAHASRNCQSLSGSHHFIFQTTIEKHVKCTNIIYETKGFSAAWTTV